MTYTEYIGVNGTWVPVANTAEYLVAADGKWVVPSGGVVTPPDTTPPVTGPTSLEEVPNKLMLMDARTFAGGNDTSVSTWTDPQSTQVFSVPTGGTAPKIQSDPNGRKFLRFNGAQDRLTLNGTILPATGGFTIYAVVRMARATRGTVFSQGSKTAALTGYHLSCYGPNDIRGMRVSDDGTTSRGVIGTLTDSWQVISIVSPNKGSVAIRSHEQPGESTVSGANSVETATTDTVTIGAAMSRNGSRIGTWTDSAEFDIAALMVCGAAHNATVITSTETILANAFNLPLPSQGGVAHNATEILARRARKSVEWGFTTTHPVTGEVMGVFENTGVDPTKGVGTKHTGAFTTISNGQIVENLRIDGNVIINHANVVFRNCVISTTNDPMTGAGTKPAGTLVTYENCEVGGADENGATAIGYNRYIAKNCWVHDCEDGFRLGNQVTIKTSLVTHMSHALLPDGSRVHADCVQSNAVDNPAGEWTIVENCTLPGTRDNLTKGNSAFILNNEQNYNRRIRARANVVGSGSYTIFVTANPYYAEQFEILDNFFIGNGQDGDMWLPDKSQSGFLTVSGNVRKDGQPLKIYRTVLKSADGRKYNGVDISTPLPVTAGN